MFFRRFFTSVRIELRSHGTDSSCLSLANFEVPPLNTNDVLLKMVASPVNPADINIIQGRYPVKLPNFPFCLGNEGCFRVQDVGSGVKGFKHDDMVLVIPKIGKSDDSASPGYFGCWRKHAVVSADCLFKLPSELSEAVAATIKVNPVTAHCILNNFVSLSKGDYVVQNGANSHVGQCIIQLCAANGYKTINIINDAPYADKLRDDLKNMGADYVFTITEALSGMKKVLSSIERPKLGLDVVGGRFSYAVLRSLCDGGKMITVGNMSTTTPGISVGDLIFKSKTFTGFWLTKWAKNNPNEFIERLREVVEHANNGQLKEPLNIQYYALEEYEKIFLPRNQEAPAPRKIFKC